MSTVMASDWGYGRGDGVVYGDKDYEYDREREGESDREQCEYLPRRHQDGGGGGREYERMRVVERKYSLGRRGVGDGGYWEQPPGRGGVGDGGYWDQPPERLRRDYDIHGEVERPRMQGVEEERRVRDRDGDGRYMRESASRSRRDYDRLCDIVDGKNLPGHEDGGFKVLRTMGPGPEEEVARRVGDGKYLHQPSQEMLPRDHSRHSDIVEGKYSLGCEACNFERPRERCLGEEKRYLRVGVGDGDAGYFHELPQERFCRDCNKHSDTVDRWEDYDGGVMHRYHGYGDKNENSRDEKCLLRCYQFNEELSRVSSTALKFQGNLLLHERGKSGDSKVAGGGAGVSSERNYLSQQYVDTCQSQQLEAGKEKLYTFSDPLVVSVPPKGYAICREGGGSCGLTLPRLHTSLHKCEGHHLPQDQPFRKEVCGEDNPLCHSKDKYYEQSSTCPKAFSPGSSFGSKEEFTMSRQGLQAHSDSVGLSSMMMNNPLGYDGYGEKLLIKSHVDPAGLSSDVRSYLPAYLVPAGGKLRRYTYPDVGRRDGDYILAGSQDIPGGIIGAGEENGHLDVLRTSGMNPIADEMDQISCRGHFRDSRPWENDPFLQGRSNPKYARTVGSPHGRKPDLDVFGHGDTPLDYKIEVYKDFESGQPEEPHGYEIDYNILFCRERPDMMTSGDYYDSPSSRLSPENSSLPERISERRILSSGRNALKVYGEVYADELDTHDELHPLIVSKKSKFSSPKHGNTGRRIGGVSSQLTSQELSQSTSSVLSRSQKSTRDVKARLGPRLQDVHVSDSDIENRGSVKSRLGPRVRNLHVSHPKIKKYRSSVKNRLGPVH